MRARKYSWLLFDADGTLFDFESAERDALRLTIESLGVADAERAAARYKVINDELWRALERGQVAQSEINGRRFRDWLAELGCGADPEAVGTGYIERLGRQTQLLEDAHQVVEQLAGEYRMALITNGLKEVQRPRFEASSLRPYLQGMVVSDEIGYAKPHPGIFDAAMEMMSWPAKEEVLMVGDSLEADIRGGIGYGLDTCWCNFSGGATDLPVKFQITKLSQLVTLLTVTAP